MGIRIYHHTGKFIETWDMSGYRSRLEDSQKRQLCGKIVIKAIKIGKMIRPRVCCRCGKRGKTVAHHPDYNKPLDVLFICYSCHGKHHKKSCYLNNKK
jgi:hypothetical protein